MIMLRKIIITDVMALLLVVCVKAAGADVQNTDQSLKLMNLRDKAAKIIATSESSKSIALKALENSFAVEYAGRKELIDSMIKSDGRLVKDGNRKTDELSDQTRKTRYMVAEIVTLSAEITNSLLAIATAKNGDLSHLPEKVISAKEKELDALEKKLARIKDLTQELKEKWLLPLDIIGAGEGQK